jgi:hypothetical protein
MEIVCRFQHSLNEEHMKRELLTQFLILTQTNITKGAACAWPFALEIKNTRRDR